ncbi:hypothetical protein L0A91_02125 [Ornithinimicrobium sp. INDO-MA30-4]|nr:hypothetical protein L0A91_02125 [Ornithinimicrobium sp. INDO-MA30-4]
MKVIQKQHGWSDQMVDHLLHRYGSLMQELLESIEEDASLAKPLEHATAYLRAEIAYACTHEGVVHLEDLMCRRTRLVYEVLHQGQEAVPEIADIAADKLGWSEERSRLKSMPTSPALRPKKPQLTRTATRPLPSCAAKPNL